MRNTYSEPIEYSPPSTSISRARADKGTRHSRVCSIRSTATAPLSVLQVDVGSTPRRSVDMLMTEGRYRHAVATTAFERILASLYEAMLDDIHWPTTSALI